MTGKTTSIYLSVQSAGMLEELAAAFAVSRSSIVDQAIRRLYEQHAQGKPDRRDRLLAISEEIKQLA